MLARLGAVVFAAVAITATAIELARKEDRPTTCRSEAAGADPLRGELVWCQELGEAGTREPECLRVWAENRRRFLAPASPSTERREAR
ncbi:putative entry exclusion protein TrbK-alt [Mesorhizobium sp. M0510]|uniref:putative entry exclusion protein TrbK-alt n=1 Tax=Mesorhizobium sp. M0510 TaxID=2956954 RepID=UPI003339207C